MSICNHIKTLDYRHFSNDLCYSESKNHVYYYSLNVSTIVFYRQPTSSYHLIEICRLQTVLSQ